MCNRNEEQRLPKQSEDSAGYFRTTKEPLECLNKFSKRAERFRDNFMPVALVYQAFGPTLGRS